MQVISSSESGAETIPVDQLDTTWNTLYSQFRQLKCQKFQRKCKRSYDFFYKEMEIIGILAKDFFSKDPLKAFTALENHSKDIGLLFFFFDLISNESNLGRLMLVEFYIICFFSFRESLKLILTDMRLGRMIERIICYVNSIKSNDLLVIAVRIFEKIEKEICTHSNLVIPEIREAIDGWRYEMFISNNIIHEEVANNMKQKESIQLEELLDVFYHVEYLIRFKKGSESLLKYLFRRFRELTKKSVISSNTLLFLAGQRVEFIILFFSIPDTEVFTAFERFSLFFEESGDRNLKKVIAGDVFMNLKSMTDNKNEALSLFNSHMIQIEDGQSESDKALYRILNKIKSFGLKPE